MKFVLACDESGAKGFADRDETFPGEVGVFAGLLISQASLPTAEAAFQAISDKYLAVADKLHIADLPTDDQAQLRSEVYDAIQRLRIPCLSYAVHVAGFHAFFKATESLLQQARQGLAARHGPTGPRVKTGSYRSSPSSLHVELFGGLYASAVTLIDERFDGEIDIEVRTDPVDNPIVQEFEKIALRLLDDSPRVNHQTGFDTETKQVVRGQIRSETDWPEELRPNIVVRTLTIDPAGGSNGLVLAADVLANSLNHLFKSRSPHELYSELNGPTAVTKHPLAELFWRSGAIDLVGDRLFRHPNAPPP